MGVMLKTSPTSGNGLTTPCASPVEQKGTKALESKILNLQLKILHTLATNHAQMLIASASDSTTESSFRSSTPLKMQQFPEEKKLFIKWACQGIQEILKSNDFAGVRTYIATQLNDGDQKNSKLVSTMAAILFDEVNKQTHGFLQNSLKLKYLWQSATSRF